MFLERSLPLTPEVKNHYEEWATKLVDAPGDVVRKVVDEVHFSLVPTFIRKNPKIAERLEKTLYNREAKYGSLNDADVKYVRDRLQHYGCIVTPDQVGTALDEILKKPNIRQQINDAREVYDDADKLLEVISEGKSSSSRMGWKHRSKLFGEVD